jgi:myo-inositol-1-phosphate synthase
LGKINVAIIGAGNCASSLVQGVHFYKKAKENDIEKARGFLERAARKPVKV